MSVVKPVWRLVSRRRLVVAAVLVLFLGAFASWVLRPAALAQGSMQSFPGSKTRVIRAFPGSMIYEQIPGKEILYELTVRNDSPWSLTVTGAAVAAGSESDVFARTRVDLPRRLVMAPDDETTFVVHGTFAKCAFPTATTTSVDQFALMPGMWVTFRQFGVPRTQLIAVRDGYAGIHIC